MSKQPTPVPSESAEGPCPTVIQIVGRPGTGSLPSTIAQPDHPQYRKEACDYSERIRRLIWILDIKTITYSLCPEHYFGETARWAYGANWRIVDIDAYTTSLSRHMPTGSVLLNIASVGHRSAEITSWHDFIFQICECINIHVFQTVSLFLFCCITSMVM